MPTDTHMAIRERAYALWVEGGHQDGRCDEYWLKAERELGAAMGRLGAAVDMPASLPSGVDRAKKSAAKTGKSTPTAATVRKPRARKASAAA